MPSFIPHAVPRRYADPIAKLVAKTGITPDMVTSAGLAANVAAGAALALGRFGLGGSLILAGGGLDLLDGAVARATGRSSLFGSIFDASADRWAETANLFGLLAYYVSQGDKVEPVLLFAAMAGSIQTSYVKARVEAVGMDLKEGTFTRAERVLLLAAALLLAGRPGWGWVLTVTLWILAIGTNITAVQRLYHAREKTKGMLGVEDPH
ncbi:MAG TPA: CDP-alcohol phosphatidyltransferase family protein [Dehalococcoidia bacterium]|jgi:CDP-diacylglycerol--glycerol-3-phosphate 3-phosphatidyltransferase